MDPRPLFVGQFLWFRVVWRTLGRTFVAPRLAGVDADRALAVWPTPQLFRVLGTGLAAAMVSLMVVSMVYVRKRPTRLAGRTSAP